jgi:hypothetical protein
MGRLLTPTDVVQRDQPTFQMTLLELVTLLLDITSSEEETTRMALELVTSGEVCLIGNFSDEGVKRWN